MNNIPQIDPQSLRTFYYTKQTSHQITFHNLPGTSENKHESKTK